MRLLPALCSPLALGAQRGAAVSMAASRSPAVLSMFPGTTPPLPKAATYPRVYGSNGRTPQPGECPTEYSVRLGCFCLRSPVPAPASRLTLEAGRLVWQGWSQRL